MTDIPALVLSIIPYTLLVAFPIVLVRMLDTTGAPEAEPVDLDLEPLALPERPRRQPAPTGQPASARA